MMKWILRSVVIGLVLIVLILVVVFMRIDQLARSGVESGATYALGVPTTLDSAEVKVFAGQFAMNGLNVTNPPGFDSTHFLAMNNAHVEVTLRSLMGDTVELPVLGLDGLDINIEKKGDQANYLIIIDNLKQLGSDTPAEEEEQSAGKKYIIREITLTNMTVHAQVPGLGGKMRTFEIPDIRLNDVGSDSDHGVLMSQLTGIIVKSILQNIAKNAADILPDAILASLDTSLKSLTNLANVDIEALGETVGQLTEGATKAIGDATGAVSDTLKNNGLDTVGKTLEDTGSDLGDKLKEGVGGLFKKK